MNEKIKIIADHRESRSGIPEMLAEGGTEITLGVLGAGDYLINEDLLIERKAASDYIMSLVSGRLFRQCSMLKRSSDRCLILIEGDIYCTNHKVSKQALSGSLMSIMVRWQIPVYFSAGKEETADFLVKSASMIEKEKGRNVMPVHHRRRVFSSQVFFLQCLPGVGAGLSARLLIHFGSVAAIVTARPEELAKVKGLGKKKAEKLFTFFSKTFSKGNENF